VAFIPNERLVIGDFLSEDKIAEILKKINISPQTYSKV